MNRVDLSDLYNHRKFMNDVREGEKIITKTEKELARMKTETTIIKVGDICESTGKGTRISGCKCKVLEVGMNGKFISYLVDWDFENRSKKHCKTFERLQDIRLIK